MMETGILASLAICVTLCDLLNLSVPVFLHLWDDDYKTNLRVMSFMIKSMEMFVSDLARGQLMNIESLCCSTSQTQHTIPSF